MFNDNEYSNDSYRSYTSQLDLIPSSQIQSSSSSIISLQQRKNNEKDKNSNKLKKKQLQIYLVIEKDILDNIQLADIIYKEFIFSASINDNYIVNDTQQVYNDNGSNKFEFHIQSINKLTRYHNKNTFIRWTRYSNFIEINSYDLNDDIYEPFLLHIIECDMFIDLVLKSIDGIEFVDLFNYIEQHHSEYLVGFPNNNKYNRTTDTTNNSSNTNINHIDNRMLVNIHRIIVFIGLDKSIHKAQRKLSKSNDIHKDISISDWIDNAFIYLMYEHNIETIQSKSFIDFIEYLNTLTRLINERSNETISEIDWINKASKEKAPDNITKQEKEKFELQQTWSSMLQMIPLMSKEKAQAFIAHNNHIYSCPRKLFESIHSCNHNHNSNSNNSNAIRNNEIGMQRHQKFQNCFGESKSGALKNQKKLSKHIFNLMSAKDPDALINDV